jgi:hypothetical protein
MVCVCVSFNQVTGVTVFKNYEYGLYIYASYSVKLSTIVAVGNGVGVFSAVFGPSAVRHMTSDKFVSLNASILVTTTQVRMCVAHGL